MTDVERLNVILGQLRLGILDSALSPDNIVFINEIVSAVLYQKNITDEQIQKIKLILSISNILYNNTDIEHLPLEDGVYDLLLELYKNYDSCFEVGAESIAFDPIGSNDKISETNGLEKPFVEIDPDMIENGLYILPYGERRLGNSLMVDVDPLFSIESLNPPRIDVAPIKNRITNAPHKYPELVGTLDKCKFVLNQEARDMGVFEDQEVKIFERDFIDRHIELGILNPNEIFTMVAELKYDGISVEAEILDGEIVSARSRGDTAADQATDYTDMLKGYKFPLQDKVRKLLKGKRFGMKFEAILTYENLNKLSALKGKSYKNCRNAVSGIFGSDDAAMYYNYITLIPLAISDNLDLGLNRIEELMFLNTNFHSGEYNRFVVMNGDYKSILFQVKRFVEEAEYLRQVIPYMYDGVVVSYIDENKKRILGRENFINKYSIAIKFNPLTRQTYFTGYSFTVGQNGVITPKIHYNPVEFYGTIHNKSSGHSYKRFNTLGLKYGDIIEVKYTNDVMPYVSKPDIEHNRNNPNQVVPFCEVCPSCGGPIVISESGNSAICKNPLCPEKMIARMTNMLQKLKFKDFSEETIRKLAKYSIRELFDLKEEDIKFLGPETSKKFVLKVADMKAKPISDYELVGSLGFTNIASSKWKIILEEISFDELLLYADNVLDKNQLKDRLISIRGIGPAAAETICDELDVLKDDLHYIKENFNIFSMSKSSITTKIRFSGVRPPEEIKERLERVADIGEGSVTKDTDLLVVPYIGFNSSKVSKAKAYGIDIIPYNDFMNWVNEQF